MEQGIVAGDFLSDMGDVWASISLEERHDALRIPVLPVYVDAVSGRIVGFTPRPAFWSVFEEARTKNPQVLLLKPDEVEQRLAEQQAAGLVVVETGES